MTDIHIRDMDPEDAWDAGDPIPHRLALLHRIVSAIREERTTDSARAERRHVLVRELVERLEDELADDIAELHTIRDTLAVT